MSPEVGAEDGTVSPEGPALAVTGATGALGGRVARILASSGVPQRLLARSPERAPRLDDAVVVPISGYADRDSVRAALTGAHTLFMVSAAESADRLEEHRRFIDAAVEAGVQHVVYTSFYGASPDCLFTLGRDHHATEEHLRASGLRWTFLRDSFYLDFLADLADADGVIRGPAGTGRVAAVARDDVAAAAAAVLADPRAHVGSIYDLTGPESLSFTEVARIVSESTGRAVTFHEYDAWVSTYTAIAAGELDGVSDHVRTLTGRAPLSLAEHLRRR